MVRYVLVAFVNAQPARLVTIAIVDRAEILAPITRFVARMDYARAPLVYLEIPIIVAHAAQNALPTIHVLLVLVILAHLGQLVTPTIAVLVAMSVPTVKSALVAPVHAQLVHLETLIIAGLVGQSVPLVNCAPMASVCAHLPVP